MSWREDRRKEREELIKRSKDLGVGISDFANNDLSRLMYIFEICHKGLDDDHFCNTHCIHMIDALKAVEKDPDSDAEDKCMDTYCSDCPISFIEANMGSNEEFCLDRWDGGKGDAYNS